MRSLLRLLRLFLPDLPWLAVGGLMAAASLAAGLMVFSSIALLLAGYGAGLTLRILASSRVLARYSERLITHNATFRVLARLRLWLFSRLAALSPQQLGYMRSGDSLSRLMADINALDGFYLRLVIPVVLAVPAAGLGLWWLHDRSLTAVTCAAVLLAVLLLALLGLAWRSRGPQADLLKEQAALRAHIIDGVEGLADLLASGAGHQHASVIARSTSAVVRDQLAISRIQAQANAITQLTQGLMLLALLYVFKLSPTLLPAALGFVIGSELLGSLQAAFLSTPLLAAASRRIFALADTAPALPEPAAPVPLPDSHTIRFNNVSLTYGRDRAALSGLTLTIKPGERIALMGPSGAGKSSIANLLLRFAAPESGSITVGGTDLAALSGQQWRTQIGYLSQHTRLVAGTLRDNLMLAKPDGTDEQFRAALEAVELGELLDSLPEGLETWIGADGLQLSGGQARRVALAMVVLRDAPLWLLDEPTEGLDAATAQAIMATLKRLSAGRSLLLITHDESLLASCGLERMILLENGQITTDTAL